MSSVPLASAARLDPATVPSIEAAGTMPPQRVLDVLASSSAGLSTAEVAERTVTFGPNAVRSHHTSALSVLIRQVSSPLLWLLLAADRIVSA